MSNPIKSIGKVVSGVVDAAGSVLSGAVDFVKKAWPIILIAAAAYFTGGFGLAATGAAGGGSAAAGGAVAGGEFVGGGAATGLATGAATGAATSAATGASALGAGEAGALAASGPMGGAYAGGGLASSVAGQAAAESGAMAASGQISGGLGAISNTAAGTAGVDTTIENIGSQIQPGMTGSQASAVVDNSISTTPTNTQPNPVSTNPTMKAPTHGPTTTSGGGSDVTGGTGGGQSNGFLGGVKKVFGKAGNFVENHPYASLMAFQTLSNLSQPSASELHDINGRWVGAFYGMDRNGNTSSIQNTAFNNPPGGSIMDRARQQSKQQQSNTITPNISRPSIVRAPT